MTAKRLRTQTIPSHCLPVAIGFMVAIVLSFTMAGKAWGQDDWPSEAGVSVGALFFLGPDLRIYYREAGSPYLFGFRYLDIEDDFVNEESAGLPGDSSDKRYTTTTGIYTDYLFGTTSYDETFYASLAFYSTKVEIECYGESDSDSAVGLYFGGGYRGKFGEHIGYNIGILGSPFVRLEPETPFCSEDINGDFDLNVGLSLRF